MRFVADAPAARSAAEWRAFWETWGTRELRAAVSRVWPPLVAADAEARAAGLFRIAALLGSRASAHALAGELGRIRAELGEQPAPLEDAAGWMTTVGAQWDRRLARLRGKLEAGK